MNPAEFLPKSDKEADDKLIVSLAEYVGDYEMPIETAKVVLKEKLRNTNNFKMCWNKLLKKINYGKS